MTDEEYQNMIKKAKEKYLKQFKQDFLDKRNNYNKKWRNQNLDKIKQQNREDRVQCEYCGSILQRKAFSAHKISTKCGKTNYQPVNQNKYPVL